MSTVPKPEPALSVAAVIAALSALLALLVSFGVSLTADQTAAILGFAGVAGPLVAGAIIRGKVRPVETSIDIPVSGSPGRTFPGIHTSGF